MFLYSKRISPIKLYEEEIFEFKEQGLSQRKIGDRLGILCEKMHDLFKRHNWNQRKVSAGEGLKRKGRPWKGGTELPPSVQQLSKLIRLSLFIVSCRQIFS